jgi:hypothetical protein
MSLRLLSVCEGQEATIHTALDDLESFLWLLIWGIVYATKGIKGAKDANPGIKLMLKAWSGDANSNLAKLAYAQHSWDDAVFGDLIQQWLDIFRNARKFSKKVVGKMTSKSMSFGSEDWVRACDELELYCNHTYEEILQSGFRHLGSVNQYPDWDTAVAANFI